MLVYNGEHIGEDDPHLATDGAVVDQVQSCICYHDKPDCIHCFVFVLFINQCLSFILLIYFIILLMVQQMSNYRRCTLHTCTWTDKKELKTRNAPVSVYTFKDNKIKLFDRNEEFFF